MSIAKKAMQLKRLAEEEAPWDAYEEAFSKLSDDLEDLRGCIENNKASLDCFRGDISVREIYQRVCGEIEREEAELQELEDFVNHGEERINVIKVTRRTLRVAGTWSAIQLTLALLLLYVDYVACQAEGSGRADRRVVQGVLHGHRVHRRDRAG